MADLKGRTVAYLEARRSAEMELLIRKHNGVPYAVPCMKEVVDPKSPWARDAVEAMCDRKHQVAVFLTGVGAGAILESAAIHGRLDELLSALHSKRVAVRGPKPLAVLKKAGVPVALEAPPPHTSADLLRAMRSWNLAGLSVVVQAYDGPGAVSEAEGEYPIAELLQSLRGMGAEVAVVFPYRWESPDEAPLLRFVEGLRDGRIHAVAATNSQQVRNLFQFARVHGLEEALRRALGTVIVGAQGPVCQQAWETCGVRVDAVAEHGHMGALVLAIARFLEDSHRGASEPDQTLKKSRSHVQTDLGG